MRLKRIYIIAGKAKSGKDTVTEHLKSKYPNLKIIELKYTFYLRKYVKNIKNWDGSDLDKPRTFLQELGTKLREYDPNYFVRRMLEDIEVYKDYYDIICINDARLIREITKIKEVYSNVIAIKVIGPENNLTPEQKQHETETELENYEDFDYIVDNTKTIDDLEKTIDRIVSEVEYENTNK